MQIVIPEFVVDSIIKSATKRPFATLPGYMERSWFIPPTKYLPFDCRLHHILRSDLDRHLHDHPWDYTTIILRGGYWEELFEDETRKTTKLTWHGPGSILQREARSMHRLRLPEVLNPDLTSRTQTAWTLFFMGQKKQDWGFWDEDLGKRYWKEYLYNMAGSEEAPDPDYIPQLSY